MTLKEKIIQKLFGNTLIALSFSEKEFGQWEICALVIVKDAEGEIAIIERNELRSADQLATWLSERKELPVVLNIETSEILSRVVAFENFNKEELLRAIVPQSNSDDFFLQGTNEGDKAVTAIARKHVIEGVIAMLPESTLVVDLFVEPLSVSFLAKALAQTSISLGNHQFALEENKVTSHEQRADPSLPEVLKEEGIQISEIGAYAAGFTYFSSPSFYSDYDSQYYTEEHLHKSFFTRYTKYILGGVLLIFLINAFLFMEFSSQNNQLVQENSGYLSVKEKLSSYNAFIEENRSLLETEDARVTRLVDQLGSTIPDGISLDYLEISPLYLNDKIPGNTNRLLLRGRAEKSRDFTLWLEKINQLQWIEDILKNEYQADVFGGGVGEFQLEISILSDV